MNNENDFLKELDHLGLIARLKRASDSILYSIRDLYKEQNMDIEPNWHLIFLILKKNETITMTEIADAFHISQPAVVKIINKMKSKGYVECLTDKKDSRRRLLKLTDRGLKSLPEFEKVWMAGKASLSEMLENNKEFLMMLEKFEEQIAHKAFKERVTEKL